RTHPKAFPILRETRMPAVQVEPCFITNPKEEQLLSEEPFLREVARAMALALERFFAGWVSAGA
ncbi:MAG: N-acetylmuramoyl-L-alanine amidase family protein, partial [Actinomycetota bacterium]